MLKTIGPWIVVLAIGLGANDVSAGLFASKETKQYKKLRDVAHKALAAKQFDLAQTNFLAAHAVLTTKGFKSIYYKESLIDVAVFFARQGKPYLSEPYLVTLRDHYVKRRGTNNLDAGRAYSLLGQVQRLLYKFEAAEESLKRAEHTARWKIGRYSVSAGYAKARLGQLYVWMRRDAEAIALLEAALKQMGTYRTEKRFVRQFGSYTRVEKDSSFRPDPEDVADVLLAYAVALRAQGRDDEAQTATDRAREMLLRIKGSGDVAVHILTRTGGTHEARREVSRAEAYYYAAAKLYWDAEKLSQKEKLRGNEIVMKFHVRQGHMARASGQESIMLAGGASTAYLDELNIHSEALTRARNGDGEQN